MSRERKQFLRPHTIYYKNKDELKLFHIARGRDTNQCCYNDKELLLERRSEHTYVVKADFLPQHTHEPTTPNHSVNLFKR